MRTPKGVSHALQRRLNNEPLEDEELEAIAVWQEQTSRRLGRKTGRPPKGPLKRLREAGWVALDYYFLRKQKSKRLEHVSSAHHISPRTLWNRLALIDKTIPRFGEIISNEVRLQAELQACRQMRPIDGKGLTILLTYAIKSGETAGLREALKPSAAAKLLLDKSSVLGEINKGCFEEVRAWLLTLPPEVLLRVKCIEQVEALAYVAAMKISIRNVRRALPNYCK